MNPPVGVLDIGRGIEDNIDNNIKLQDLAVNDKKPKRSFDNDNNVYKETNLIKC